MKEMQMKMENQNVQMKKQIESLNQKIDSVNSNIIGRLDNVELNMKELKEIKDKMILNIQQDNNQLEQINHILQILDKIIADIDTMKLYVNGKIKENKEEIGKLMKEIDILKERIKELQNIIVSRKIIKILLKKIINNCFDSYTIVNENKKYHIYDVKLKEKKYKSMINVANNLFDAIYKENKILEKDDLSKIKDLFDEKIINLTKCYPEIIEDDIELKKILGELSNTN
jgi:hypothetical protein